MPLKYNTRLIKARRSYTSQEIANLFGINKATCRRWFKSGLSPIEENTNPLLIMGEDLIRFLKNDRQERQTILKPDEYYCFKCRKAVRGEDGSEKKIKLDKKIGKENKEQYKKTALCEFCQTKLNRFLSVSQKD